MSLFRLIVDRIVKTRNPILYWKKKGATIGDRCSIHGSADLGSEPYLIKIGDHVRINAGVSLVTHDGGLWVLRDMESLSTTVYQKADAFGRIQIGNNCHIGTNVFIMPGVTIGNNVVIGCGAVVTRNIPDNSVVAGVPARVIETIDEYAEKIANKIVPTKGMSPTEKKKYLTRNVNISMK